MEREILVRGKSVITDEWVEGYYFKTIIGGKEIDCIAPVRKFVETLHENKGVFQIILETRGEFTGLTDKNDTRIFEGDILRMVDCHELVYQVVYRRGSFLCQTPKLYEHHFICSRNGYVGDMEVIGNIHDNPELMGGGDLRYGLAMQQHGFLHPQRLLQEYASLVIGSFYGLWFSPHF